MSSKEFRFEPEYLSYSNESFLGMALHQFQIKIRDIFDSPFDCLFVNAPTGTGKTLSFGLPTFCNMNVFQRRKTLIISPTNLLINQIYESLTKSIREHTEIGDVRIRKLTGKDLFQRNPIQRQDEISFSFTGNDILVSNPDIISLLISGFYYTSQMRSPNFNIGRLRNPEDIFAKLDVIVFDEYHVYSEEELGKIFAFILLSRLTGNHLKVIFASATPDEKIMTILTGLKLTYDTLNVFTTHDGSGRSRKVRGLVNLTFSDEKMLDKFKDAIISTSARALYLFDHKVDAERAIDHLLEIGIDQEEIQELTGFMQRSTTKKEYSNKERFVIATNAAEQGLNLDVNEAHIEPGLYLENLSQRYGRIGRSGAPGSVTIHVDRDILRNLPEKADSFIELEKSLRLIFRSRESYASRIKRHLAAFMALCAIRSVRNNLKNQIIDLLKSNSDITIQNVFKSVLDFDNYVYHVLTEAQLNKSESLALKEWWEQFLSSLGYFRGQSITVSVKIIRSDGSSILTTEDLRWIKKWCKYDQPDEKLQEFTVTHFYNTPMVVTLEYTVPMSSFLVNESEMRNREKFRNILVKNFNDFIEDGMNGNSRDIDVFKSAFEAVSHIVYPEMLVPKEILDVSETQIL